MCGIAGIWQSYKEPHLDLKIKGKSMAEGLIHRGPDDSDIWIKEENGICFAHRRLSIIDLSKAGNQPMVSSSKRYVITFNGEIYNHKELRNEIQNTNKYKYHWEGNSDTETFLESIENFGLFKTLDKSCGMFAFALWDDYKKELFLVRDRFGEKPLYWGITCLNNKPKKKVLVFSSELSGIFNLKGFEKSINFDALNQYFKYGYVSYPNSIQDGIKQLPPGSFLKIKMSSDGLLNKKINNPSNWWDSRKMYKKSLDEYLKNKDLLDENYFLETLEKKLSMVVSEQAINSDVPVGCFLSGGIDSSLITTILQKNSNKSIKSFTAKFEGIQDIKSKFDESNYAKNISKHLGTNHTEVTINANDVLKIIPQIGKFFSEPFSDSSQVPTYLICECIKSSGISVALSGDGADELFGGYNRHKLIPSINKYFGKLPMNIKNILNMALKSLPVSNKGLEMDKLQKLNTAIFNSSNVEMLYDSLKSIQNYSDRDISLSSKQQFSDFESLYQCETIQETLMMADTISYLTSDILVKLDRSSMACSLETRVPFLDKRIAEISWMMPLYMKINNKNGKKDSKWALKKILGKYIPKELINRPKQGFCMPTGNWLSGPLNSWAEDMLSHKTIKDQGYLNPDVIENIFRKHKDGIEDNSSRLWNILMWQSWLNEWY